MDVINKDFDEETSEENSDDSNGSDDSEDVDSQTELSDSDKV